MAKLKAPEGVTSASVCGEEFKVSKDGTVNVPDGYELYLYQFGFVNAQAADVKQAIAKAE